jgi:membrane fusion protein, multidrug efflux system
MTMAQRTDTEVSPNPPAEAAATETHTASPLPAYRRPGFFQANPRARLLLVVAAILLVVGAIFAWRYFSSYESTDDAEVDGHLMPLSARISGYVSTVNVDDNQYVQAGAVLVETDPRDYQTSLD